MSLNHLIIKLRLSKGGRSWEKPNYSKFNLGIAQLIARFNLAWYFQKKYKRKINIYQIERGRDEVILKDEVVVWIFFFFPQWNLILVSTSDDNSALCILRPGGCKDNWIWNMELLDPAEKETANTSRALSCYSVQNSLPHVGHILPAQGALWGARRAVDFPFPWMETELQLHDIYKKTNKQARDRCP